MSDLFVIEIGYRLARAYWARGLASEAAGAVRDYAFGVLALPRLVSIIDPNNSASIRVAEKNGLRHEKDVIFREKLCRMYVTHNTGPTAALIQFREDMTS
jgi:RimJ/RimL family protein N-acetyltransferase